MTSQPIQQWGETSRGPEIWSLLPPSAGFQLCEAGMGKVHWEGRGEGRSSGSHPGSHLRPCISHGSRLLATAHSATWCHAERPDQDLRGSLHLRPTGGQGSPSASAGLPNPWRCEATPPGRPSPCLRLGLCLSMPLSCPRQLARGPHPGFTFTSGKRNQSRGASALGTVQVGSGPGLSSPAHPASL